MASVLLVTEVGAELFFLARPTSHFFVLATGEYLVGNP